MGKTKFIVVMMLGLIMICCLVACGNKKSDSPYVGEWEATYYEASGIKLSAEDIGASLLTVKDNGRISAIFMGEEGMGKWKETDDGIILISEGEEIPCSLQGSTLVLEYDEVKMYFEKEGD